MKRIILICIGTIIVSLTLFIMFTQHYYSPAKEIKSFKIEHHDDDTIRIAFIGDSWAFFHKHHTCKMDSVINSRIHRPVKVMSEGGCGATSRFICNGISPKGPISNIICQRPDYCILSAGINDSHLKMGKEFYTHNMSLILHFLKKNNITPIILEIPDYDIYKVYSELPQWKKVFRRFSMFVTGSSMDCRNEYRQELSNMLQKDFTPGQIHVLGYDQWPSDALHDTPELYRKDRIHLNEKGYALLDSCLARIIITDYSSRTQSD